MGPPTYSVHGLAALHTALVVAAAMAAAGGAPLGPLASPVTSLGLSLPAHDEAAEGRQGAGLAWPS